MRCVSCCFLTALALSVLNAATAAAPEDFTSPKLLWSYDTEG